MFPSRPLILSLTLALALGVVTGCAAEDDSGKPEVMASFYPLQYVAERIVGDHAEVANLTMPGVEPHDLELSPRQTADVSSASVVFYEKGLQPAVDEAVANDRPEHVVDATEVVELHHSEVAEGHDEEGHEETVHEDEEGHDHEGTDPHFWLDPTLLAQVADAFTDSISEADSANADAYRAANQKLQADLQELDGEFRARLADCKSHTLVVSHDAFGYLGRRYDLDVHPIAGLSPDAEPSPRHLAELSDLIRTDKVTTVFSERLASPKFADTLASDLDIKTAVLDPIEGLTSSDSAEDYLTLMRENLAAIEKAGGCG